MFSKIHHDRVRVSVARKRYGITSGAVRMSAGFSLVEVMVGMIMGLLGMIVIFQMLALFEGQKRTTSGGNDAQNSAAISLHTLQQDLQQAGYGVSQFALLNCNLSLFGQTVPIAPVIINPANAIIPAGDANTDRLLIIYGNSNSIVEGNIITALAGKVYTVQLPSSFAVNDRVIASANPCVGNLLIDQIDPSVPIVVGAQTVTVVSGVPVTVPSTLYNLGRAPQILAYAIRNANLTVCDYMQNNCGNAAQVNNTAVWVPIANNIVSLLAEYGHDNIPTAGGTPLRTQAQINAISSGAVPPAPVPNYVVNRYDQTTPTTNCGWARTPVIRLVLVGRGQYEKDPNTTTVLTAPAWTGSTVTTVVVPTNPAAVPIVLTGDVNWGNYRYKTMETVVPIQNVVWMGVQAGC